MTGWLNAWVPGAPQCVSREPNPIFQLFSQALDERWNFIYINFTFHRLNYTIRALILCNTDPSTITAFHYAIKWFKNAHWTPMKVCQTVLTSKVCHIKNYSKPDREYSTCCISNYLVTRVAVHFNCKACLQQMYHLIHTPNCLQIMSLFFNYPVKIIGCLACTHSMLGDD